jgi:hypothetical protein
MMPALTMTENGGRVSLRLGGLARGEGASLQEAADDLVRAALSLSLAFRSSGFNASAELWPDLEALDFLYALGEIAAAGGDIRPALFG